MNKEKSFALVQFAVVVFAFSIAIMVMPQIGSTLPVA